MKYPHNEKIKNALHGKADFVQKNGLNYLIPNWQLFIDEWAETEDNIDEWLNYLDGRHIIEEIMKLLPNTDREKIYTILETLDEKFKQKTFEINECVWGEINEKQYKYNKNKNWYYYRLNQIIFDDEKEKYTKIK